MAGTDTRLAQAAEPERGGFRPDIEGMRAVAIGLVMLYHAGLPLVSGFVGVDVFFVISGFLITGLLVKEVQRTGRVSLRNFYARRAKRLLPATALVLAFTAVMTWLVLPVTRWREFGGDIVASATYLVNWRFAERSVDYLAEGVGTSPVLHFWSLAVEEQFYLVWPFLLVAATFVLRRWRRARLRPVLLGALLLVALPTFLWSITYTSRSPDAAFFVTTTRLWELAVGAFVAIGVVTWQRLPSRAAAALGWVGITAVVVSAFVFGSQSAWPGAAALLPTLGTAAVIVAGTAVARGGPGRLLSLRPLVAIGGLSYSLYLWHWPLLVFAEGLWGELGRREALAVVLFSFLPAALSMRLVENPIRFSPAIGRSPRLALSLGANFSLVGVVAGLVVVLAVPTSFGRSDATAPGASALSEAPTAVSRELWRVDEVEWMVPEPVAATSDVPESYDEGCQVGESDSEFVACEYGDPAGDLTVAMVGDSKVLQWQPALAQIARDRGWRLVTITKSACALAEPTGTEQNVQDRSCAEWNDRVMSALLDAPPDVLLTANGGNPDPELLADQWRDLLAAGVVVVPLLDNPAPGFEVYECVAENPTALSECAFDRAEGVAASGAPEQLRAAELTGVPVLDLTDVVCPGSRCPAVIGNVLVYRQGTHLTRTFVESAAPELSRRLLPLVEGAGN